MNRILASGATAGALSTLVFTIAHHVLISDIWFSFLAMLAAGVVCGASLAWTYRLLFPAPSARSWWSYNVFHVLMLVLLAPVSLLVFEPITTVAAVIASDDPPNELIAAALPLSIAFAVIWAAIMSALWARTWAQRASTLVTSALLTGLLGLNVSIIGLVELTGEGVALIGLMFLLVALILLAYAAIFHVLERRPPGTLVAFGITGASTPDEVPPSLSCARGAHDSTFRYADLRDAR